MAKVWRPGTVVAKRIGNALLRGLRDGQLPDGVPAWLEATCIHAITHDRLTPGARAQLGRLWRQFGSVALMRGEAAAVQDELGEALRLAAG